MRFLLFAALCASALGQDTHYCPDGWVVSDFDNEVECILLGGVDEKVTNDDASILCQFHGGWLVDMDEGRGPAKNNFLKSLISDADGSGGIGNAGMQYDTQWWIGAHVSGPHGDHNWGNWTWDHSGAEVQWYDWMRNEPNDWHSQNCLTFLKDQDILGYGSYHWNDWDCDTPARFICERPPLEAPTTTTTSTTKSMTTSSTTTTTSTTTSTTTTTTTSTDFVDNYLFLGDKLVLSLPSFQLFSCQMDLPDMVILGEAGVVTDSEDKERLMVCFKHGCHLRLETGWEEEVTVKVPRALAASSSDGLGGWLVTGGQGPDHYEETTETFKDGSWSDGPNLPYDIYNHCQVLVEGQIVIAGGRSLNDVLIDSYNLEGNVWVPVGSLSQARQFHACAELSGRMYSIGGDDGAGRFLDSVELYDPASKSWSYGPTFPVTIAKANAINFQNSLYVLGGQTDDGAANKQIFKLSEDESAWEVVDGVQVDEPYNMRNVFPAQVVTMDLLHCSTV